MTGHTLKLSKITAWILFAVAAMALATIAYIFAGRSTRNLPYHDRFADGKMDDWHSFGGTWEITDSAIRDGSNDRGAKLITGSTAWHDYSIEGDMLLRSVTGYASDAGFVLRSSDEEQGVYAYNGYFALLHTVKNENSSLLLGRVGHGPAVMASVPLPAGIETESWYHLKLLAQGCRLVASVRLLNVSGTYVAEATDPHCLTHGRAGLLSSHAGAIWRNISVQVASAQDATAMRAAPATLSPASPQDYNAKTSARSVQVAGVPPQARQTAAASIPISSARLDSLIAPKRATITGQVILTVPEVFVQDPSGGMPVRTYNGTQLKIGDQVTATGVVSTHGLDTAMQDASLHILWEGTPAPAVSVTASRIASGAYDGQYIDVEGVFMGKRDIATDLIVLDFVSGSQTYQAVVHREHDSDLLRQIKPRSTVRLQGVATRDPRFLNDQGAFAVLVHSGNDLQVVTGPPWWRFRNLILIVLLLALALLAVAFLYRRVERLKLLAVVQERERLAYEMHDTLAQSVAGIGFQLEAIRAVIPPDQPVLQQQLDLAQELVHYSHTEARRSIDMLRSHDLQRSGLLLALRDCASHLVTGSNVTVSTESINTPRPICLACTDALFRIGQEALANSVRHASPTRIRLALEYGDKDVTLTVQDDGCGFGTEPQGHTLGILSMRKRAEAVSANLIIRSIPEEGTIVTVRAPLFGRTKPNFWRDILRIRRFES
jgi:signal transduction histidine kinase